MKQSREQEEGGMLQGPELQKHRRGVGMVTQGNLDPLLPSQKGRGLRRRGLGSWKDQQRQVHSRPCKLSLDLIHLTAGD